MAQRLPDGDKFQDGDVLTAADLNDTFNALIDVDTTLTNEVLENRWRNLRLEIVTNSSVPDDRDNLLVDFLTDSNGYQDTISVSNSVFVTAGDQFENYHAIGVNNDYVVENKSVSTGLSGVASAWDEQNDEYAVVTRSEEVLNPSDSQDGRVEIDYELLDNTGSSLKSNSFSYTGFEYNNVNSTNAYFLGPGTLAVIVNVDSDVSDSDTEGVLFVINTDNNTLKTSDDAFEANSTSQVAAYDANGTGEVAVTGQDNDTYLAQSGGWNEVTNASGGYSESIMGMSSSVGFLAGFGESIGGDQEVGIANDGSVTLSVFDGNDNEDTEEDRGFEGTTYFYRPFDLNQYVGVDVQFASAENKADSSINGSVGGSNAELVAYNNNALRADNNYVFLNGKETSGGTNVGDSYNDTSISNKVASSAGPIFETTGTDPINTEILKGEPSVIRSNDFTFEFGPITASKQLDYIKAEFETSDQDSVDQYTLIDDSDDSEVATLTPGEREYIENLNVQDVRIKVKRADYPLTGGVQNFKVITW